MKDNIMADGKWITHGITFEINKPIIRPQSMGILTAIVKVMNENPELHYQVSCYAESIGEESANAKLSDQRAKALKMQFVTMGIDASRLTSKGYTTKDTMNTDMNTEGSSNNISIALKVVK